MSTGKSQVSGALTEALHKVGDEFRGAAEAMPGEVPAEGIDPSTKEAVKQSHEATRRELDRGAEASDTGREFTKDVEEHARESAADIDGVDAKTELSSGQVSGANLLGAQAAAPAAAAPAAAPQPMWAAPPQPMAMPAGAMGGAGGGMGGGGSGGGGFSLPSFGGGSPSTGGGQSSSGTSESAYTKVGGPAVFGDLDAQQVKNAKEIINTGLQMGMSRDDIEIGLMTAMAESNIRRLANESVPESLEIENDGVGADHDSTGPFQQRQSWGATADLMDPATSAEKFFSALAKIPDRDEMDKGAAAQAVQRSAYPDAYSKHEQSAGELLDAVLVA